ncbi:competence type IV pilus assembly protein ComGB [Carnobacterium gallinarum]|uniref:competence type IV pilus assembly protein ComGB n=1 Tax=Carnobacterium gallinarum TaxID=2749 RepID=UPI0005508C55|nr:competence type IV pilus assembly protein ComGB [Carnobacterium gallinarum]
MDLLQKMGIKKIGFIEPIKESKQAFFLSKLAVLVEEGFSLKEALNFLILIMTKEKYWLEKVVISLESGQEFYQILAELGFSERISAEIYLAQVHGQFSQALANSGLYLEAKLEQRKKLKQLLHYPLLLVVFMLGILFAMRLFLLPYFSQLFQKNDSLTSILSQISIGFIYCFPYILAGIAAVGISLNVYLKRRFKHYSAIAKIDLLLKIGFLDKFIKLYYTYYFSYEWAQLFKSGHKMLRIIQLMKEKETTRLMQEVALKMEDGLKNGHEFNQIMEQFNFFTPELGAIIFHGELTSQLASELSLYSASCQKEFVTSIEKLLGWIQPVIFFLVAFFILCIYLALLLPMFTMMEGIV